MSDDGGGPATRNMPIYLLYNSTENKLLFKKIPLIHEDDDWNIEIVLVKIHFRLTSADFSLYGKHVIVYVGPIAGYII